MFLSESEGYRNDKLLKVMGALIRIERKRCNYTQKQLSKDALIHSNYVRDIEQGKKSVTVEVLYRICNALGIGISEFFQRVEELMAEEKILFL